MGPTLYEQYLELHKAGYDLESNEIIQSYVKKLQEIERLLPDSNNYMVVVNAMESTYEYITKNFENATGYNKNLFYEKGFEFFFPLIHPDDLRAFMAMIKDLFGNINEKVPKENKLKTEVQLNFRLKDPNGNYLNLVENHLPIYVNDEGKIAATLSRVVVLGTNLNIPVQGSLRTLNSSGYFETAYYQNFSQKMLSDGLTNRERDIINLLALGYSSKQISEKLFISPHTVNTHRRNLLDKLNIESTYELIAHFKNNGTY